MTLVAPSSGYENGDGKNSPEGIGRRDAKGEAMCARAAVFAEAWTPSRSSAPFDKTLLLPELGQSIESPNCAPGYFSGQADPELAAEGGRRKAQGNPRYADRGYRAGPSNGAPASVPDRPMPEPVSERVSAGAPRDV